jgi:hypothetical protein
MVQQKCGVSNFQVLNLCMALIISFKIFQRIWPRMDTDGKYTEVMIYGWTVLNQAISP